MNMKTKEAQRVTYATRKKNEESSTENKKL